MTNHTATTFLDSRPLPANVDSERYVLGAALNDQNAWPLISELLTADDFSLEKHKRIFGRLSDIFNRGDTISLVPLIQELQQQKQLESVDGMSYLIDLQSVGRLVAGVLENSCRVVHEKAILRRCISANADLMERCYLDTDAPADLLADAERITETLTAASRRRLKVRTVDEVIEDSGGINKFLAPHERPGISLPPNFDTIDTTLGGLRQGKLILLAARPAVGKSALVHEWMIHAAEHGKHVLLVTLEMTAVDVLHRELTGLAQVSSYQFRRGELSQQERDRIYSQTARLSSFGTRLRFLDQIAASVSGLSAILRSLAASNEAVELLVIDYLQLMQPPEAENRVQEVSKLSRGLKTISQAFNIPVLAICNLSRKGAKPNDEPQLDWLRDSGQLEFDADQVVLLWPEKEPNEREKNRSIAWKVAKNKDGRENRGTLRFHLMHCRFMENWEAPPPMPTYSVNGEESREYS